MNKSPQDSAPKSQKPPPKDEPSQISQHSIRNRKKCYGILLVILLVTIALGSAYASWPFWSGYVLPIMNSAHQHISALFQSTDYDKKISNMDNRLSALEKFITTQHTDVILLEDLKKRHDTLETKISEVMARIKALNSTLSGIQHSLSNIDTETPKKIQERIQGIVLMQNKMHKEEMLNTQRLEAEDVKLRFSLNTMATRLNSLETQRSKEKASSADIQNYAAMLAIGQLREILRSSAPFIAQFTTLNKMIKEDKKVENSLKVLAPLAKTGVPTHEDLRVYFSDIAYDIVRADFVPKTGNWAEDIFGSLMSIIRLRRTADNIKGDGVDVKVARIEGRLKSGDLAGAVQITEELKDKPAEKAEAWLKEAKNRLNAETALSTLESYAISSFKD